MVNYVKGIKAVSDLMRKKAKMIADFSSNPKSVYSKMHPNEQMEHVNAVLDKISKNPDLNFNEQDFLDQMGKRMFAEQQYRKNTGMSLNDVAPENPELHAPNYALEIQADDFLRKNDPEFFEELEQAKKSYDENVANLPSMNMLDLLQRGEGKGQEKLLNAIHDEEAKKFLIQLFNEEFNEPFTTFEPHYELSRDPRNIDNLAGKLNFPETTLNKRYHNVPVPNGEYYFGGQHKPADYYHNILWNYINKSPNRDAMLEEFFQDILHKPTPTNPTEKFNTIKRYKDALDKRRLELDMKNKPYNKHKLNNMQAIEEYFENQRPYSFEDFESSTLSPGKNSEQNYYEILRNYRKDNK